MSRDVFEQIRERVSEERENVAEWLDATPLPE